MAFQILLAVHARDEPTAHGTLNPRRLVPPRQRHAPPLQCRKPSVRDRTHVLGSSLVLVTEGEQLDRMRPGEHVTLKLCISRDATTHWDLHYRRSKHHEGFGDNSWVGREAAVTSPLGSSGGMTALSQGRRGWCRSRWTVYMCVLRLPVRFVRCGQWGH